MAYRELSRMEIIEVVRRWQAGESRRAIARASGLARATVTKYLRAAERLDAACARALGFDLLDVRRLERILVLALEHESQPAPPRDERLQPLPAGRFARPGSAFDHRYPSTPAPETPP
jgi:AcrR family transcriptional regulator